MSRITQRAAVAPVAVLTTTTDTSTGTYVGQRFDLSDGREVVLVQNGGTALSPGNLISGPAVIANHQNISVTAFTAYSANGNVPAKVTATLGATAVTANQYAGGYLFVNAGTGQGQTLKIASHPAAALSASVAITLEDSPVTALDATSKVCLGLNPYGSSNGTNVSTLGVVIFPHTSPTGAAVGVSFYPIGASTSTVPTYGLIQTRGQVACLNDATTAVGLDLMPSTNTDGAVMTYVVATGTRVGVSTQAGVTTESRMITVQL